MAMERITKCDLVIPHKQWALNLTPVLERLPGLGGVIKRFAQQEYENLKAIEIWARRFRLECVGGGATMCGKEWDILSEATVEGYFTESITLESSATIKVDVTVSTLNRVAATILPAVNFQNVIGPRMSSVAVLDGSVETAHVALTYITTLPAGTHDIGFYLHPAVGTGIQEMTASMTWIIGVDTGCNNVVIGGGA